MSKFQNVDRPSRMVRPKTDQIYLSPSDRPVDYGECRDLLIEKYGLSRGDKYYDEITAKNTNTIWTITTEIQKEKRKMIADLKKSQPSNLGLHEYYELWTEWRNLGLYKNVA
jgi:hypothetical protein